MTDKILCLDTVKKNRDEAKALAFAKAKPDFLNLVSEKEKRWNKWQSRSPEENMERQIQRYARENQCTYDKAKTEIHNLDRKREEIKSYNKAMTFLSGAYAIEREELESNFNEYYKKLDYFILSMEEELEGKIASDPKEWLYDLLHYSVSEQIKQLELFLKALPENNK